MLFLLVLFVIAAFFFGGFQAMLEERGINLKKTLVFVLIIVGVTCALGAAVIAISELFPHAQPHVVPVEVHVPSEAEILAEKNDRARQDDDTNIHLPSMATNDLRRLSVSVSNFVVTFYIDGEFYRSASVTDSFAQSPVAYFGLQTNLSPDRAQNTNWQLQIDDQPYNGWRNYSPVFASSTEVQIVGWTQNYRLRQR